MCRLASVTGIYCSSPKSGSSTSLSENDFSCIGTS